MDRDVTNLYSSCFPLRSFCCVLVVDFGEFQYDDDHRPCFFCTAGVVLVIFLYLVVRQMGRVRMLPRRVGLIMEAKILVLNVQDSK